MRAAVVVIVFALACAPSSARADAVGIQVMDCPPGAHVVSYGHVGIAQCEPFACEASRDCPAGNACSEVGLCLRPRTIPSPGHATTGLGGGSARTVEQALGACHGDGDCADGATCVRAARCVVPQAAAPATAHGAPPSASSGGCDVAHGGLAMRGGAGLATPGGAGLAMRGGAGLAALALGLAALALARRVSARSRA